MKPILKPVLILLSGLLIGALVAVGWLDNKAATPDAAQSDEKKPLYWVAPMDPNYRRDAPGKSPMGMDLIPVYEEDNSESEVGTVSISPDVVNNLGVRTAPVTLGHLDLTINTVGYVQYNEDRLIHIHPRVEGWIEKLYVKAAGDPVKEGEPLYAIYAPTLVNAQEELLLAQKRNNPVLLDAAMQRLSALQVPSSELKRLQKTGKVSQTITIRAPQSGVLDNLDVREGMYVKPGMEMMIISQLEHVWVIGEVFERQAMSVQTGDSVVMHLDYLPGREWSGSVDYIYPSLNTQTRTARVRVHFDNPDGYLRPGMFAQMAIATQPTLQTLLIPREALIRTGSQARVVLAMDDGHFKSIAVKVGRIGAQQVEILSGLKQGDRIVTSAQFLIDSESSKTSDFQRMHHGQVATEADGMADSEQTMSMNMATVDGVINHIDPTQRLLNISRGAIEKWDRPAATLDFSVIDEIDLQDLAEGDAIRFTFSVDNGEFTVTAIEPKSDSMNMDADKHQEHNHD